MILDSFMAPIEFGVTRKHELNGRALFVLDGLFASAFVELFYRFLRCLPFYLSEYDSEETKEVLHWKSEFDHKDLPEGPFIRSFFSHVRSVTEQLFPAKSLNLDRAYCNNSLYGDHQSPHQDSRSGITSLYFANSVWETNWMGETIFYNDEGEPVYAVIPKPGRLIVFAGDIVHRGGVPSRECFEPRLSLAFKFVIKEE
jgi:SM-20-related protein